MEQYSFVAMSKRFDTFDHARGNTPQEAYHALVEQLGAEPNTDRTCFQMWRIPRDVEGYQVDDVYECIDAKGICTRVEWGPGDGNDYEDPTPTTPWHSFSATSETKLAVGITADRCGEKGGLVLSDDRMAELATLFPSFGVDELQVNCFSDSADFAVVVFAFPSIATDEGIRDAIDVAMQQGVRDGAEEKWVDVIDWLFESSFASLLKERSAGFDSYEASLFEVEKVDETASGFRVTLRRGNEMRSTTCVDSLEIGDKVAAEAFGYWQLWDDYKFCPGRYKGLTKGAPASE